MNSRFALDRSQGKLMGVCAGIARSTGIDPTIIRIGAVVATLAALGPAGPILYIITAMVAENG
jgi:phage shock protein C